MITVVRTPGALRFRHAVTACLLTTAIVSAGSRTAGAQQQPVPQPQQQQPAPPQPAQQPPAPRAFPQSADWSNLPKMVLERQFAGPLQDTVIQRWRDPVDGTACYIFLPITAEHSPPTSSGFVQYGSNTIGSISCVPAQRAGAAAAPAAARKP